MSDILQEAEALIEKHATSGYIHRDATLLLPELVEEIKRLQADNDFLGHGVWGLKDLLAAKDSEIRKWQQIAIKQRALINFIEMDEGYAYSEHVVLSDDEISIAAKELSLQGYKTAYETNGERYVKESEQKAYIDRLEAAYLDMWRINLSDKDSNLTSDQLKELDEAANNMLQLQAQAALEKIRQG